MKEIVLVAPYEKMLYEAKALIEARKYSNVDVVFGDLTEGLAASAKAVKDGAKVLISRGGTYSLIQYISPVPVVEIGISVVDIADTIKNLLSQDKIIGIIGYKNTMSSVLLLKALGKKVIVEELNEDDKPEDKINKCIASGAEIIVGDAVTCRIGRELGCQCYLTESGSKSIENAIEEAQRLLKAIYREEELLNRYKTLTDSVHDGIIVTNEQNQIVAINLPACRIFGLSQKNLINMPIDVLNQYGVVISEIKNNVKLKDELRQVGTTKIEFSNYPVFIDGKPKGSIAVFQDITEVQSREKNIRAKLVEKRLTAKYSFNTILYKSKVMENCINVAKKMCEYDSSVLIEGESGTGKELFAQSIHNGSRRRSGPFVAVNCAALPPSLIESVLFGYAEGAFTGGVKGGKEGVFEMAHTGTLFLDEIGELPLELQGRLLRVVQEHEVMRIGGNSNIPLDIRLICATNRNLRNLVKEGKFRQDLLYRINVLNLYIPSLNERKEDIEKLAVNFFERYNNVYVKRCNGFTEEAMEYLKNYRYEGNVRELQNIVERALIVSENSLITVQDLTAGLRDGKTASVEPESQQNSFSDCSDFNRSALSERANLKSMEIEYIKKILAENGNSVTKASEILNINRSTLWRKLKKAGIR